MYCHDQLEYSISKRIVRLQFAYGRRRGWRWQASNELNNEARAHNGFRPAIYSTAYRPAPLWSLKGIQGGTRCGVPRTAAQVPSLIRNISLSSSETPSYSLFFPLRSMWNQLITVVSNVQYLVLKDYFSSDAGLLQSWGDACNAQPAADCDKKKWTPSINQAVFSSLACRHKNFLRRNLSNLKY